MFDFLDEVSPGDGIPAGHFAMRFIRHVAVLPPIADASYSTALPTIQLELARRIVSEIEQREGTAAVTMNGLRIEMYVNAISDKLQNLSRVNFKSDPTVGKTLLEKLRQVN